MFAVVTLPAQEVDPDLPLAPKNKSPMADAGKVTPENNPYLLKSDPPTAFYSVYSDLNRIKWLTVPVDSSEPISQEECDRISDVYIADCRKKAMENKNAADSAYWWRALGQALIFRSRWDEAIEAYKNGEKRHPKDDQNVAACLYGIADCHLGAGRTNECVKALEDILSRKLRTGGWRGRSRLVNYNVLVRNVLHWLKDEGLVGLDQPRWTDCKPFPEPQKAEYTEKYVDCHAVSVSCDGIDDDDGRVRFLKKKLRSKGIEVKKAGIFSGGYTLEIRLSPDAKVDKSEGYTLDVTKKSAVVTARDKQGVLWGIVSFLQVIDYARKHARICSVEDWPDCPKRGFLGRCAVDDCEFMIFNKMNINTAKPNFLSKGEYTPINVYKATMMAREFNNLGFELYYGFGPLTMDQVWPLCWNVFLEMQLEHAMKWASCGVGIYYPYDDARYWDNTYKPEDKATGKKPSDFDADHLYKFYTRIKAKYPAFKMQFCPPFYWGPRAGHPYPDNRDKYLKSLRKLPEDVSMFWTGERVGSHKKHKPHCDWYSGLIGRKPSLFQNKAGPHGYLSFVLDEMPWDDWYYEGFVDRDMRSIQKNSDTPEDFPILSTLADYLWNVKAYDRTRAVRRGIEQYAGRGVYDILKPAYDQLCRVDAYTYGRINSRVLQEDEDEWKKGLVMITNATEKVRAIAGPRVMRGFGSWERAIGFYRNVYRAIRKPPDYRKMYAKPYENLKKHLAECGYDEKAGDIFIDPLDFKNGCILQPSPTSKRKHIYPESTITASLYQGGTAVFKFKLDKAPANDYLLELRAISAVSNKMRVALNGEKVRDDFDITYRNAGKWLTHYVIFPKNLMKQGENTVWVKNSGTNGYPIKYEFAIIKKKVPEEIRAKLETKPKKRP